MARIQSKQKGNNNERECAKILNERFGKGKSLFQRVPSSGAWGGGQNREARADMALEQRLTLVSDIMTPLNFNFVIEHKAYNSASFWDLFNPSSDIFRWIEQVKSDASSVSKKPMLVVKYNNKKRIVFVNEEVDNYIFKMANGWHCLWFEEFLRKGDEYFFEGNNNGETAQHTS